MVDGRPQYRMMGEGDLPIPQMLDALVDIGYDGYISLEWVKRWAQELSDAGVVFPQFANYMHDYFATLLHEGRGAAGQSQPHRQVCLAQGDPDRRHLPRGAGPHGQGVPRPAMPSDTPSWTTLAPIRSSGTTWTSSPGPSSPWA